MDITGIRQYIDECVDLLKVDLAVSEREAEMRAGRFLNVLAHITNAIYIVSDSKIKDTSLRDAVYAEKLNQDTAKNVTEKKANAEAHPEYAHAREAFEVSENTLAYLRAYQKIFTDAHVFFRQLAKGDYNG